MPVFKYGKVSTELWSGGAQETAADQGPEPELLSQGVQVCLRESKVILELSVEIDALLTVNLWGVRIRYVQGDCLHAGVGHRCVSSHHLHTHTRGEC